MGEKSTVSDTNLEEIIFYTNNSNAITFYYKTNPKQIDIYKSEGNILEYLSCKKFENGKYVCAFNDIINDAKILKICMFFCNDYNCNITHYQDIPDLNNINDQINFIDCILFDTSNTTIKVIIVKTNSNEVKINFIDLIDDRFILKEDHFQLITDNNNLNCDIKNCDFKEFHFEYLLYCACSNYIICYKISNNFQMISDYYKLNFNGENSHAKIMDEGKYVSIFVINNNSCLYRINMQPTSCKNSTFDLEKEQEIKINFKDLLNTKLDDDYYTTFNEFDDNKVTIFKENNDSVIIKGNPVFINNDNNTNIIFSFILNNILYIRFQLKMHIMIFVQLI